MKRNLIRALLANGEIGQTLTVCGWVRTRRESKGVAFLSVNDGSSQEALQVVVSAESPGFQALDRCTTGAAIRATGILRESPARGQRVEVEAVEIEVFGDSDPEQYPLQKKGHTLEFLRDIGHLRPRTNTFGAVFRIRNILATAVHEFFQSRGFLWVHTPIITASDSEGAGALFTVTSLDIDAALRQGERSLDFSKDFFGRRAYLTVSGQLEAEALAMALGNVYTFGPTFRAENSISTRHLAEFWMIEPEMAFADLRDNMRLAEEFIQFLCRAVLERSAPELSFLDSHYKRNSAAELERLAATSFVHITYTDAIEELKRAKVSFEFPVHCGLDLQSEHERHLTDRVFEGPVIVTDYPKEIKAFYMRLNDDGRTVAAMDLLAPRIGEIIGGSQREERFDVLEARMKEMGIPRAGLQWYLDLRRFGSVPHAGFGLGFERLVQYITGMVNIRDAIPFPRAPQTIGF